MKTLDVFIGFGCSFARANLVRAASDLSKVANISGIFSKAHVLGKYVEFI